MITYTLAALKKHLWEMTSFINVFSYFVYNHSFSLQILPFTKVIGTRSLERRSRKRVPFLRNEAGPRSLLKKKRVRS